MRLHHHARRRARLGSSSGFTLVELLVVAAISVTILSTAVLIFQGIVKNQSRISSYGTVTLGAPTVLNYYGQASTTAVDTYVAPSYGRAARADRLRARFWEDLTYASAVFVLPRSLPNSYRPQTVAIPADGDATRIDGPEAFRQHIISLDSSLATIFNVSARGPVTTPRASIFILGPSESEDIARVIAIFEIDMDQVTVNGEAGTYVSVRRHEGTESSSVLTGYYDTFYPGETGTGLFSPIAVTFERRARLVINEGAAVDRFKKAADQPFYLIWWPDPANTTLGPAAGSSATYDAADPRSTYATMGGRTSYLFAAPMFPALAL